MPSRPKYITKCSMALQGLRVALVATLTLTFAATLHAQVVSDPKKAEFDPSPDHWTVLGNGQPAVSRYDLEVYVVGVSVPFAVVDMGKLAPQQDGKCRFDFSSKVALWALPGGTYEARVRAVGPGGFGLSTPSNGFTFTLPPACGAFSLLPTSVNVSAAGGVVAVTVTGTTGCARTATSNASWITVTAGATGTGSGAVSLSVAANTVGTARTGTVTIGGKTFSVTQAAANCIFTLSKTAASVAAPASSSTVGVTAASGCGWSASSNAAWLTITSGGSGSGNGTVGYTVAANTTTVARTGVITIAGRTLTITQAAAVCTYSLSPGSASISGGGGSGSFALTTMAGCTASATSSASWVTLTGGATGSASRTVSYSVAANTGGARNASITVGGQTFSISQAKKWRGNSAKADFTGDSMADLLWQHDNGAVGLWEMNGLSATETVMLSPDQVDPVWKVVGSGDLDGDGRPEIVWQHQTGGWLSAWFMNGEALQQGLFLTPNRIDTNAWQIAAIADLDGDFRDDLVWQHDQGSVVVWYMDGVNLIGSASILGVSRNDWKIVGAGDIDGDTKPDLVWQQTSGGLLGAWLLNGATPTSSILLNPSQASAGWKVRGVVDLDGDGQTDLLWQDDTGAMGVWLMNGTTATSMHLLSPGSVPAGWRLAGPR